MGKVIAVVGAGAVGGYVGGLLAHNGHDVTLIDHWPEHIDAIRKSGLQIHGLTPEERYSVKVKTMHLTEVQSLSKKNRIDIAFISVKSYDTEWATMLIAPYLAPDGYVVSLQNCINDERIAEIVGWGKAIGCIVSRVSSDLVAAGEVHRTSPFVGAGSNTFYVGEVHGRVTKRLEELAELIDGVDGCQVTTNLWGMRWSKLCVNVIRNGVSAATGMGGNQRDAHENARRFSIRLGGEAVRVGKALGYDFDKVATYDAESLALAAEGNAAALKEIEGIILHELKTLGRSDAQLPSMGQDIRKGRRTEIEYINGFVAAHGDRIGIPAPTNAIITDLVKKVERGELKADPDNLPSLD